jgi:hypothetical protein
MPSSRLILPLSQTAPRMSGSEALKLLDLCSDIILIGLTKQNKEEEEKKGVNNHPSFLILICMEQRIRCINITIYIQPTLTITRLSFSELCRPTYSFLDFTNVCYCYMLLVGNTDQGN